ncbi:MAG: DUF2919 domain-containing protein, partial [Pseudoalteromonas nigrifaciens]
VLWYLAKSRYLTVFFNDWPEPTEKSAAEKRLNKD